MCNLVESFHAFEIYFLHKKRITQEMIPSSIAQVEPPLTCARVIAQDKGSYVVATAGGESRAQIRGALLHENTESIELPVVGDYVAIKHSDGTSMIERVLERKNLFTRRAVWGSHSMQPIAANIDTLFITMAMNRDFNLRRIERYAIAAANKIPFVVLLTKSDLMEKPEFFIDSVSLLLNKIPVFAVSAVEGDGLDQISQFLGRGKTIAFVGSSGVGKSTLINALLGEDVQFVQDVREQDDRGRHTTTRRLLLQMEDGTSIIDTPGMRGFALADAEDGIHTAFAEVLQLSTGCRFSDCRHNTEPDCAVRASMDAARYASYQKLEREAAFEARKNDPRRKSEDRLKWRAIHKENRRRENNKYKNF
jgi:ribosome biogenesis GTPase